ncbi:peptide/nickel transport system permease protein [Bacillus horti]|uniref:Peptide/nickel transport system permease protein n=2 Tax=Caldalkalibacillus horti TaxID=77523 RepID=A0ABT9VY66_9BACI|nr:peptide/nickel transport system permease protein [Bacillus horti]
MGTDAHVKMNDQKTVLQQSLGRKLGKQLKAFIRFIKQDTFVLVGVIIYAFLILLAIFAPLIAPHDPHEMIQTDGQLMFNQPPSKDHWLGTTNMGRDIFSQLVYGVRPALLVGFTAAFLVVVVGTLIGLFAGYFRGIVDNLLMRVTDVAFGIPFEPFVIVLVAFMGASIWNIVLAMALLLWRDTARVIRSQVLTVRERNFVEAAKVSGASHLRILFVQIAPNILPLSFLYGSLAMGWAILTEAAVSFLGFGDPTVISWGYMLQDAYVSQALSRGAYYWFLPPGIFIMLAVMAGFYIGRGSEEILYPRLKKQ